MTNHVQNKLRNRTFEHRTLEMVGKSLDVSMQNDGEVYLKEVDDSEVENWNCAEGSDQRRLIGESGLYCIFGKCHPALGLIISC